jgi:hypothetical protein
VGTFCSGVPYFSNGPQYSELLTDMMTPADAQPREISSTAMAYDRLSMPLPPKSVDTATPIMPSSPSFFMAAVGYAWSRSSCPAIGFNSVSAKFLHMSAIITCSSFRNGQSL